MSVSFVNCIGQAGDSVANWSLSCRKAPEDFQVYEAAASEKDFSG